MATRSSVSFATDPREIAEQAGMVAAAWSPTGAPPSWRLTAAQFEILRDDPELLAIAATIPPDRLPPLLFSAAANFLVRTLDPDPLRDWFPRVGAPQPPLGRGFVGEYRAFCLDHRDRLTELCAVHRYQMNEVGRCADVVPALAPAIRDGRQIILVDVGTGAGLALHLDRYRYVYRGPEAQVIAIGPDDADVVIETEVRGPLAPPVAATPPVVVGRFGIDIEPLDLSDPGVLAWLSACVPQEIGAVTRFHQAAGVAIANPVELLRGDAIVAVPELLGRIPDGPLVCLMDTYVHVFFQADELRRFRDLVDLAGAERDLDWVSIDPLVPMGRQATASVLGIPVPPELIARNRSAGIFGVVGRLCYRGGHRTGALMGLAHPGAAWLEWLAPAATTR